MRNLLALLVLPIGAAFPAAQPAKVPRLIFPVVGRVAYHDDFGEPRGQGPHQGIDIVAARKAPAVAAEAGTVQFWTTSASAGCMLYLRGLSGTVYQYIHLNNDLGKTNDNRGNCVPGVAYSPGLEDGAVVNAGQAIALVGDSGDANGLHPHLHFEVHPGGKAAIDPFRHLKRAQHLLFAADQESTVTLSLTGTVLSFAGTAVTLRVKTLRVVPSGPSLTKLSRTLTVGLVSDSLGGIPSAALVGKNVVVLTEPALATLAVQLGKGLTAARVAPRYRPLKSGSRFSTNARIPSF